MGAAVKAAASIMKVCRTLRLDVHLCNYLLFQSRGDSDESADEGDFGKWVQQQEVPTRRKPSTPNLALRPRTSSLKPASRWKWEGGWTAGDRRTLRRDGADAQALTPEVEKALAVAAKAGAAAAAQKAVAASASPTLLSKANLSPSSPTHSKDINDSKRNSPIIQSSPTTSTSTSTLPLLPLKNFTPSTLSLLPLKSFQRQPSKPQTRNNINANTGAKDRGAESKTLYIKSRDRVSSTIYRSRSHLIN